MSARASLLIGGVLNLLVGLFHISFPWLLQWPDKLGSISSANRAVLYSAHVWIILVLLSLAYISIFHRPEMLSTRLGGTLLLVITALWLVRSGAEVIFFRLNGDGAWWRLVMWLIIATLYLFAFLRRRTVAAS